MNWTTEKFGSLRLLTSDVKVSRFSHQKLEWLCDCGKTKFIKVQNVTRGLSSSCGLCNVLPASYWKDKKFGSLKLKFPKDLYPKSSKKEIWVCDCGNEKLITVHSVTNGMTVRCGLCNLVNNDDIEKILDNGISPDFDHDITSGCDSKLSWKCSCGQSFISRSADVFAKKTKSCGKCFSIASKWYARNEHILKSLKIPINPSQIPDNFILFHEVIMKSNDQIPATCYFCKSTYFPIWNNVRKGASLSCGCISSKVSYLQYQIYEFIKSYGIDVILEYKNEGSIYDIYVPDFNLFIEFNGLRWHSFPSSRIRDLKKYEKVSGHSYLLIFEDEWKFKRSVIEDIIRNKIKRCKYVSIRPSKCLIRKVSNYDINTLYEKFHYIGRTNSSVNYGVYFGEKLIAGQSFSRPTRTTKHDWELTRMVSDPSFRVHGIWSKLLSMFMSEYSPDSIVSYSDNRMFSGDVYKKLGFTFDGNITPDYYWVKGGRRYHKSGLRKTEEEKKLGLTETQLRYDQGYEKIWDIGKKRWVLDKARYHK